jgi:xylulokinase
MFLDVTGTWELVITPTSSPKWSEEIRKCGLTIEAHAAPDLYCLWAGGTAASMLEWYKDQIGTGTSSRQETEQTNIWLDLMDQARSSPPGSNGVFFLPHFNGVTCPVLDPRSQGAFVGLNDSTRRADMIRAVIEGINFSFLEMLKSLETGAGQKAQKITAIGGGTRNELWMQTKADISGLPVETPEIEEATAMGAAMLAGMGAGVYKDLAEAVRRVYRPGKVYEPNPKLTTLYAEFFDIYREIHPALQGVNTRIYNRFRM